MPVVEILLSEEERTRAPDQQNIRGRMVVSRVNVPAGMTYRLYCASSFSFNVYEVCIFLPVRYHLSTVLTEARRGQ